jgi:hypothetical protein
MPLDRVQMESRFRPRYTTGLNPIEHPSDPNIRTGVHTGSNFNPLDRNRSPSPEKMVQADDAIGDPKRQRHGNEYRDIRAHEALPATLTKTNMAPTEIWTAKFQSSLEYSHNILRAALVRTLHLLTALISTQPSVTLEEKSVSQSLKRTINSIQYISVVHSKNWSSA